MLLNGCRRQTAQPHRKLKCRLAVSGKAAPLVVKQKLVQDSAVAARSMGHEVFLFHSFFPQLVSYLVLKDPSRTGPRWREMLSRFAEEVEARGRCAKLASSESAAIVRERGQPANGALWESAKGAS